MQCNFKCHLTIDQLEEFSIEKMTKKKKNFLTENAVNGINHLRTVPNHDIHHRLALSFSFNRFDSFCSNYCFRCVSYQTGFSLSVKKDRFH